MPNKYRSDFSRDVEKGATWHPNMINPILALRVIRANHWWADFWKQIVPETKINESQ